MKKRTVKLFSLILGAALCLSMALPAAATMDVNKYSANIFGQEQTVAVSDETVFMLKADDSLWAWGSYLNGVIGNGMKYDPDSWTHGIKKPYKILDNVKEFSASETWAITKDNALWVWGPAAVVWGLAEKGEDAKPQKVMDDVRWFSYGESKDNPVKDWRYGYEQYDLEFNLFVVKTDGTLLGWGANTYGELGIGSTAAQSSPVKIMDGVRYVQYVEGSGASMGSKPGYGHIFAIKEDGSLWGWGADIEKMISPNWGSLTNTPEKYLDNVKYIRCVDTAAVALTNDGGLYAWGVLPAEVPGSYGYSVSSSASPEGFEKDYIDTFYRVASHVREAHISYDGRWFTYVTDSNEAYNWDFNGDGYHETPTKIMDDVATMSDASERYIIKTNGELWQYTGETYDRDSKKLTSNAPVKLMSGAAGVVCSSTVAFVVKTDGSLWGKGGENSYELMGKGYQKSFIKLVDSGVKLPYTGTAPEDKPSTPPVETPPDKPVTPPAETVGGFTDVTKTAYYADAVKWAVERKVTNGTTTTTFSPDKFCTRGEIVTFLWRAYGSPEPVSTENPFTDVKPTDFFYKAVLWAAENDVTSGTGEDTFSPNDPCNRAEAVTFQYRAAKKPAVSGGNTFSDVSAGTWYSDAVSWAVEEKITNGTTTTTFSPDKICTRGDIVTFLWRDIR